MQKQGKNRKSLIIGIVAAVVILAVVLVLLLTQCTGGQSGATTAPSTTVGTDEVPTYELYWNLDRAEYEGKSEAGMSSRMPESDGYFHVRFILDGEEITLKVQDRKVINKLDVMDLMGLVFDDNGIVTDVLAIEEMPLQKVAWQFYVQSAGGKLIKANSSESFGGMEIQLEGNENTGVYDMTGKSGPIGCVATPIEFDRIYAVQNLAGQVTHVFIYERSNYMLTHEGECQHCEKTVTWYEWVREDKLPTTSGHYQLMNDISLSVQQSMAQDDQKICLDLNGKRVDGKNGARVYSLHNPGSSLAIMDTSEGETGVLAAHGKGDQGMVVWVRYGQFHLYGGTLDGSDATTKLYGTTVQVPKNSYFYMHGGTIIGGTAAYVQDAQTGAYSRGYGGSVHVAGKFVMNDGEIRDGFAQSVTYKKNGTTTTTRGYGGNLFVSGTGEVELLGGVIKNGKAGSNGGNIYMDGACTLTLDGTKIQGGLITGSGKNGGSVYVSTKATMVMKSGSISGGACYNGGGNMYINGTFTMSGGSIWGGKCYNYTTKKLNETSTNYNIFLVNGTFKMYGGRVYGGVGVTDSSTTDNKTPYVGLATYATIKSDDENATNLTLNTGGTIICKVDALRDSASIGINTARGLFTAPTLEANRDKFFSDIKEAEVIYTENGLFLGREKCVCGKETHMNGCDGTKYLWGPWISATSLPKAEGNYFFIKDVTTTAQYIVNKGETVRVDLNGYNATYKVPATSSDGYRLYRSAFESLLVITDTTDKPGTLRSQMATEAEVLAAVQAKVEDGTYTKEDGDKRIAAQKAGNFGQILWSRGGDIIVHNGILDGSNLNGSKYGMTVYIGPNTASEDGGVTRKGSFTMYGGVIKGATSTSYGASLTGSSNSIITIHGGVIEGGVSTANAGGNLYISGEFYMDGGIIRDGKAYSSGGNLTIDGSKANATITGNAQILNGEAGDRTLEKDIGRGGNIRVVTKGAKLTLSGNALISGGKVYRSASSKAGYGGNISINTDTTMVMTGGTVENGVSDHRAGNIDVCGTLNISGGTVTGGKAKYGGNIYVLNGTGRELNMTGGTVEKGHATSYGGNIQALALVNITGGVVAEGKALPDNGEPSSSCNGGNIYACDVLNIGGDAIIRDGCSSGYGGNISLYVDGSLKGNATISGNAQILNGVVDGQLKDEFDGGYGGNIRASSNTTVTVKENALIAGGQAIGGLYNSSTGKGGGGQGGNLFMANATVNLLGGVMENGVATGGGGNIGVNGGTGTLIMDGVIVRNGDTGTSSGGNIRIRGTGIGLLEIKGDTQILNGKANQGGNIHISPSQNSIVNLSGNAKIAGGQAAATDNGGNLWITTKVELHMSENAVIDGTGSVCKRGGAVYMNGGVFSMTDNAKLIGSEEEAVTHGGAAYLRNDVQLSGNAQIIGGSSASYGGSIYFHSGAMTLQDDAVIDGSNSTSASGATIYIYDKTADVQLKGNSQVIGGTSTGHGGAIYLAAGKLTVDGAFIQGGKTGTASSGGAIYTSTANSEIVINSGTIVGGQAKYGGALYIYNGAVCTMNGGTIEGGEANRGGNVVVEANASGATFTMNGGTISGGQAVTNGSNNGQGGNIWLYNNSTGVARFNFNDGTVSGGVSTGNGGNIYAAANTAITMKAGKLADGVADVGSGGNAYVSGSFTMDGGAISGGSNGMKYTGSSKPNGGSIYVGSTGTFVLNDGSVSGGKTINTGGNFVVYGNLEMNGGSVYDGVKIDSSGAVAGTTGNTLNIYVINANMKMTGGTIDGRVALYNSAKLTLSGDATIHTEDEGVNDLYLNGTTEPITIESPLGSQQIVAEVRLNSMSTNVFSTVAPEGSEKYFTAYEAGLEVFRNADGKLEIGKVACICGFKNGKHIGDCDGTKHNWSAWTSTTTLPTTTGYWYLTADVNTSGSNVVKANNQNIALDLNGYTVYGTDTGARVYTTYNSGTYQTGNVFTLVNSGNTGMIQGWKKDGSGKSAAENGSIIWASSKDTVINLYNITLDASKNQSSSDTKYGMAVSMTGTDSKLNIFNSKLLGGTSAKGDAIGVHDTKAGLMIRMEGDVTVTGIEGSVLSMGADGNTVDVSKVTSLNAPLSVEANGVFTTGWDEDTMKIEDYFVSADENTTIVVENGELAMRPYHCVCGMPDGKHVEGFCDGTKHVWKPWSETYMPSAGNWYLTGDVTSATDYRILSTDNVVVRVDLNGFDFTSGKNRMFTTYKADAKTDLTTEVILTNTAANDRSVVTVEGSGNQGRVMWLRGENKSFKAYNIDFKAAEGASGSANGFFFSVQPQTDIAGTGNHLELYNVTLTGGNATGASSAGALCGGAYTDVVLKNVTITGCSGTEGGAIRMVGSSTLTMEDVVIDGCEATGKGAAIYATGTCAVSAKNLSITGCTGKDDTGIYLNDKATLEMTGKVVANVYRTANTKLDVSDLTTGSAVVIAGNAGVISANTYTSDDADLAYLSAGDSEQYIAVRDGKLNLLGKECMCGMPEGKHVSGFCDQVLRVWQPWSGNTAPTESGNYYLTDDLTVEKTVNLSQKDAQIVIDLNGHDIKIISQAEGYAGRMYTTYLASGSTSNVRIALTNRSSDASTVKVEGVGDEGRVMWLTGSNKELSAYNVDFDLSTAATSASGSTTARKDGIAFAVAGSGNTLKLFDSTITGGYTASSGGVLVVQNGNSATMTRCTVNGSRVKTGAKDASTASGGYGGFAYVRGTLTLNDCTIKNCEASQGAGAIYLYGTGATTRAMLIMNGGSIEGCKSLVENGGAIGVQNTADIELNGVTIKNCSSASSAGAIHVAAGCTAELTDCEIIGTESTKLGGAIYLNSSTSGSIAQLKMSDCTIKECSAGTYGGAIVAGPTNNDPTYTSAELVDTTIENCSAVGRAGGIHVSNGSSAVLDNVTITGCKVTGSSRGGAVYSYKGNVTLLDTTIKNNATTGTSPLSGGVHLYECGITLGGKIVVKDNTAGSNASGIYIQNATRIAAAADRPLSAESEIGLYSDGATAKILSESLPYSVKDCFYSNQSALQIIHDGSALRMVSSSEHWHCVCGGQETNDPTHVCEDIKFTVIDSLDGNPSLATGNYYLADDFKITHISKIEPTVDVKDGAVVNFCLDGHTLSGAGLKKTVCLQLALTVT